MIKKLALLLSLALAFCTFTLAQDQDKPMPGRWRGLIIDQSTPEDAIKVLGQPASDKTDNFRP